MVKRKRDANKIIVIGLPEGTDNEALEAMFADIGKVVKRERCYRALNKKIAFL
jgi:hypothetical protein